MTGGFKMGFLCTQHDNLSGILNTFCLQAPIGKFQSDENRGKHSERENYEH